ncbi:hypothetical protein AVEN_128715-1 [Araneus ventricosus]|uniref:Uncharacterized protein n=1 Tax=Araneus ventricosus TaxID=182803 RepID=A0A4Y2QX73_ARAVE|nr:hypothetical protein AVEN_128715-1 [Araneus ventricosus]
MKRKLSSIQRPFLLQISRAYRTTPTAALQTILGIPPLHMQLQFEARFTSNYRLRISLAPNITDIQPQDLEMNVNRLVHSYIRATRTETNLFRRRRSKYSPKRHYKYFHRLLENQTLSCSCLLRLDQ